jgi:hypothetical protein
MAYQVAWSSDRGFFNAGNFFSFFTIESNILGVIVLGGGALLDPRGRGWQWFRGAVTLYMTITGVVYNLLLTDTGVGLTQAWVNDALHRILPLVILVDFLLVPPVPPPTYRQALAFLAFPLAYFGYSLIRGAIVDWYPYPFVDVNRHGYDGVALNAVVLAIAMAALTCLLAWINRRLVLHRARVHHEVV